MKVFLPNDSRMNNIGGGWRFRDNLIKGANSMVDMEIVDNLEDSDISLIAGATMILPETFTKLKEHGKVVLRLDGVPEAWRNSGRAWGRFKHYFTESDGVICQSEFVRDSTFRWLAQTVYDEKGYGKPWQVIMNGVDKDIFRNDGDRIDFGGDKFIVLNINSRKDENKRIEEVIARYRFEKLKNPKLFLLLVGQYPTYLKENDFGLYDYQRGQDWEYLGMKADEKELAKIMRSCDEFWFPSFADPCPNVLIEAIHCGCYVKHWNDFGGVDDIMHLFGSREVVAENKGYDFSLQRMAKDYYLFFNEVLNGKNA